MRDTHKCAGAYEANAKASGLDSLVFVAAARAGRPATVALLTRTDSALAADSSADRGVTVEVRDSYQNLVRGATVIFTTHHGVGGVESARVITDSLGRAHLVWELGEEPEGRRLEIRTDSLLPLLVRTPARPIESGEAPATGSTETGRESLSGAGGVADPALVAWAWPSRPDGAALICWQNALGVIPLDPLPSAATACEELSLLPRAGTPPTF